MSKRLAAAGEVDAYCTHCKLDLGHRIIAMVGDTIKRVECLTCRGHHAYRPPRSGGVNRQGVSPRKRGAGTAGRAPAAKATRGVSEQRQHWEQAIMGRAADDFAPYRMDASYQQGQLVRHARFGDVVVTEVRIDGKVGILFESGPRTLVCAT